MKYVQANDDHQLQEPDMLLGQEEEGGGRHARRHRAEAQACRTQPPRPLWAQGKILFFLCPCAVYYLRYAVRSFFTISRLFFDPKNCPTLRTGQIRESKKSWPLSLEMAHKVICPQKK